jgi:hypothetical protein
MEETEWANYGHGSGNPKCQNCMVHSGFEPSAVNDTFGSIGGMVATVKAMMSSYDDPTAMDALEKNKIIPAHARNPLVQIAPQER